MSFEAADVERKTIAILKVLSESKEPLGSRVIARRLKDCGIDLSERAVRYHLKLMDERGLTQLVGRRDGRLVTDHGIDEIGSALVSDKVGLAISRIELLAFRTGFDLDTHTGPVPINVSYFPKAEFNKALRIMKPVFASDLCVSPLVTMAQEGEMLGELRTPQGFVGMATVCSVVISGALLKAGVPMDSKFSGILQFRNSKPHRFVELIYYSGCSLDPSDVFIRAKMTSVAKVINKGEGRILATFRELPAPCQPILEQTVDKLARAGIRGVLATGNGKPVCEVPVEPNRIGMVVANGLNPVAAAVEAGLEVENYGMSTIIDFSSLVEFRQIAD